MIKQPRQDRRITRTKNALHQALLDLVKEKSYSSISVEEIVQRANLGRATFYLHYKDKEDLLLEDLTPRLNALVEEVGEKPLTEWYKENQGDLVLSIFTIVRENADLFALITRDQSNRVFDRIRHMIMDAGNHMIRENTWLREKAVLLAMPVDYFFNYFAGAIWASIVWWAGDGFKKTTEEMGEMFGRLFAPGLWQLLDVKNIKEFMDAK